MKSTLDRHEVSVLQFSGGKDSLACLYLLRPYWDRIVVMWTDTGDAFPETREQMTKIEGMVPHFVVVRSQQPAQIEANGWPAEVLPTTRTAYGRVVDAHTLPLMQPYSVCCGENIWAPMMAAVRDLGATLIIRGTRLADKRKSLVRSGDVVDGIEYLHPIENWDSPGVRAYLQREGVTLPAHYWLMDTSLDCRMCTAYLHENIGKMRYMRTQHPTTYREVMRRLADMRQAVGAELSHIDAALEAM